MSEQNNKTTIETPSRSKIFKAYIEKKKEQQREKEREEQINKTPHLPENYSREK